MRASIKNALRERRIFGQKGPCFPSRRAWRVILRSRLSLKRSSGGRDHEQKSTEYSFGAWGNVGADSTASGTGSDEIGSRPDRSLVSRSTMAFWMLKRPSHSVSQGI